MTEKHTCDGVVFSGYRSCRCGVGAKHEHEGHWYCKTHHPPTVKAKRKSKAEERNAEYAARTEQIRANKLAADEQRRRADCYDELMEALKDCAAVCAGETMSKSGLIHALGKARAALARATGE